MILGGKYEALVKLGEDELEESLEGLSTQELLELLKNKDKTLFFDEEALDEIQDELEDSNIDSNIENDEDNDNNQQDDNDNDNEEREYDDN